MKEFIVIHHSLTKDGQTVSWDAIRRYHMKELGFSDIGYHAGLEIIGNRYEKLLGRMMSHQGAHCKDAGMNQRGIGIVCVGNFDLELPSLELLTQLTEMVRWTMEIYKIPPSNVIGHWEAQAMAGLAADQRKSCPGKLFNMDVFRARIRTL